VYDNSRFLEEDSAKFTGGHGGGDRRLVRDWIQAISQQDASLLTSTIDTSIESHIMGFMAEQSRKTGKIESIQL
jgi:hypothetical protein